MHKIVGGAFKALMVSGILLIVSMTLMYLVQVIDVTYRVRAVAQSMQTDIAKNNCLKPSSAKLYGTLLQDIENSFNSNEEGFNAGVVNAIGFNCGTYDSNKTKMYKDGTATEVAKDHAERIAGVMGTDSNGKSKSNIVEEPTKYDSSKNNIISSVNIAGQYGDISILDIKITFRVLNWVGLPNTMYHSDYQGKFKRSYILVDTDLTYAIPLLKYITVEK